MKKAVITILGTIGGKFDEKGNFIKFGNKSFYSGIGLENVEYFNMLPLLMDKYLDYEIVPIYTEYAKNIQKEVLERLEKKSSAVLDNGVLIKDENDFDKIFEVIDKKIDEYDRVIVDVTHGFRHLPLLMLIDLLVQNIKNPDKIEHILFAKELRKPVSDNNFVGNYEIIDLRKYLDLANITYALSTFTKNYTISSTLKTSVKEYNKFLGDLNDFSFHILANSLKELENKAKNLITQIDKIMKDSEVFSVFNNYLLEIKRHMEYIYEISKEKKDYKRLYFFSKNMFEKGYLLNSITLLSEAMGMYIAQEILSKDIKIKKYINGYKNSKKYNPYLLANNSKNIVKFSKEYKGSFLTHPNKNYQDEITNKVKKFDIENKQEIVNLISIIDRLRNNLAHGNSSEPIENVEKKIKNYLNEFRKLTKVE